MKVTSGNQRLVRDYCKHAVLVDCTGNEKIVEVIEFPTAHTNCLAFRDANGKEKLLMLSGFDSSTWKVKKYIK